MSTKDQPPVSTPQAPSKAVQVPTDFCQKVEAALMTTDRPLSSARMSQLFGKITGKTISDAVAKLNAEYESTGRTFRIEPVAGGWQIMTIPDYADVLTAMHKTRQQTRLSPPAMEALAIIAYKQPIVRAEIEAVRGVASGEILRSLMDRHLVKIVGRAEELGRPMLYGTTKTFLEVFGLAHLKDLPNAEEFVSKQIPKSGNGAATHQADQDVG